MARGVQAFHASLLAQRQALCVHDFDIGEAEEAQELAKIRHLRVRAFRQNAAARDEHVRFLPYEQPSRTARTVLERDARSRNVVEVRAQHRWHDMES